MAGITGLGTTYNLPNYTGILFALTPSDTPFFSAIGGLTGGGQTTSPEFEWETYDLRSAAQNTKVEGATAPTAEQRVRANVTNVTQIQQEKISVAYSKLAAVGAKAGTNNEATNPVRNEVDWQVEQMLKQMVRDVEFSFIQGTYAKPGTNATARGTRGLIPAITTNVKQNGGSSVAATTQVAGNTVTFTAHGLVAGDQVVVDSITNTTGISNDTAYVVGGTVAANTFQLLAAPGGSVIDLTGTDGTLNYRKSAALTTTAVDGLLQSVFDNGGILESETATLICNSSQKRALTAAYANLYGKYTETSRNVGGVNLQTIETDFGTLNIMLNRHCPQHKVVVASLEQCMPVFLEVPEKGHFFAEPLAKTGASDEVQLYGEVGLAYGNEKAHGVLTGLTIS